MSHRVFVFGTLKEGFPNFHVNAGERVPGEFTTTDALPLHLVGDRHSPWLIDSPGSGQQVRSQLFVVSDEALARMDALERIDEADGYRRVRIRVACEAQAAIEVFAYLKPPEQLEASAIRLGPLDEYTLAHAAMYRPRT